MIVIYTISGIFYEGMSWEDFLTKEDFPNFTINGGCAVATKPVLAKDGFVDVDITEPLTQEMAEKVISDYIGHSVHIVAEGHTIAA